MTVAAITHHLPFARTRAWRGRDARRRRRYADSLEHVVLTARRRPAAGVFTSAIPVQRGAVLEERALLLELACQVREAHDAPASALAPVKWLLTDGNSPLYAPSPPGALQAAVLEAILALDDGGTQPT